jgi:uncharacterized protein
MPVPSAFSTAALLHGRPLASPSHLERVTSAIAEIAALVPPVWPLEDYVAVNPFLGLAPARFLEARQMLRDVRDCELLLPAAHFHDLYDRGQICTADLEQAFRQCLEAYPDLYTGGDPRRLVRLVAELAAAERSTATPAPTPEERRYHTASDLIDTRLSSSWSSHVITDISRHCGLHFDRGQAAWPSPWKHLALYEAWRESARISRRMDMLGITGFREFAADLPAQPDQAVAMLLDQLGVPERHWRPFLLAEIFSVAGWASFLRYRLWEATLADGATIDEHVVGLLAIRLAYDAALAGLHPELIAGPGGLFPAEAEANDRPAPAEGVLGRYLFQVATEISYRRRLCGQLAATRSGGHLARRNPGGVDRGSHGLEARGYGDDATAPARSGGHLARRVPDEVEGGFHGPEARGHGAAAARNTLQMIFCIDVRSEVFRRHLEAAGSGVQTLGFAGFFGMPLEFVPLGATQGPAQCPVLLRPGFQVAERIAGDSAATAHAAAVRHRERLGRRIWKLFQNSATSCFSFVESLGLAYLPKLLTDSLAWTKPVLSAASDGVPRRRQAAFGPDASSGPAALPVEQRIELAAGMLTNLGLLDGFARIVAICGHGSAMINNPYRAGYDCGACGGHSGEPNARVAADLLNDPLVRSGLAARGIAIPTDTWFLAAVHVTTTDEVRFPELAKLPASHADDLAAVQRWLALAGEATRLERAGKLGARVQPPSSAGRAAAVAAEAETQAAVLRRSRDWSEVRPEWGLAGNAAFIVAPRWRTAGLDLGGRTFLHDYDHTRDPEGSVLELIMTAPMVVTSWINLQYYASAVDNRSFGSGNKLIHNVTGQFGVLLGNGGDLMTGLPWQAVSDGQQLVHEPLRLAVVIEAPRPAVARVIERHKGVADLVENGWVTLVVCEGDEFFRRTADGRWQPEAASE